MTVTDARVVVVTGASGGVGRGIALACGAAGWTVWIAARRADAGRAVAAEVDARGGAGRFVPCEVGDADSVAAAMADVVGVSGRLDGVVHNATSGLSPVPGHLADLPIVDLRDHVAVSVRGTYLLATQALPHLEAVGGALVVLTSEAGFEGKAKLPAYAAVKAAQRGLVRALAREWGPRGVRVNALAPLASTPAMVTAMERDPAMAGRVMGHLPMGRLGDAEADIGPAARFLLGDDSRYVTGVTIMADGGSCPIS
ncbi:MAG TPA: SDR family oxidoreductase [Iamia sp.]|nr:SDR family oxidoreductase [Iamia sp.]